MLSRGINREAVLVSKTIENSLGTAKGISFDRAKKGNSIYTGGSNPLLLVAGEKWALATKNFSFLVIQSLVTDSHDALLDNFVVRKIGKKVNEEDLSTEEEDASKPLSRKKVEEVELVHINTKGSFAHPIFYNWENSLHFIGTRNILYCFPHMKCKVDKDVAQFMANLQPEHIVLNWIKDMILQVTKKKKKNGILAAALKVTPLSFPLSRTNNIRRWSVSLYSLIRS